VGRTMRMFVVKLKIAEDAWPELAEELASYPASKRAQRLRTLATIGLALSRDGRANATPRHSVATSDRPSDVSEVAVSSFLGFGGSE